MSSTGSVPPYTKKQPGYTAPSYEPAPAKFQPQSFTSVPSQPMHQQQQSSNVTVVTQQPGVRPVVMEAKPNDYFVLSLLTCLFCSWVCGIVALIYSSEVNSAWASGDFVRARDCSKKARTWSLVAIISHVISVAISVIIIVIVIATGSYTSTTTRYNSHYYYRY